MTKLKITTLFFIFFNAPMIFADDFLPAFSFSDVDEKIHTEKEWQSKTKVINFWATWCQPCLKEIPDFIGLQTQYAQKNVQFIGIAIDELVAVKRYKNTTAINYPILVANEWDGFNFAQQLGNVVSTVPYTVVVNPAGQIIYRHSGAVKKEDLIAILNSTR